MINKGVRLNRKKFVQYLTGIEHHKSSGIFQLFHDAGMDQYYFIQGTLHAIQRAKIESSEPLDIALGYGFAHKKSRASFVPMPHLDTVDPQLLASFSLFEAMWKGIQKHMPQTEIFSEINAVPREGIQLGENLNPPSYHNEALLDLFHAISQPISLQNLNQKLSVKWSNFCSYGDLYRAIWLLFHSNKCTQALPYLNPEDLVAKEKGESETPKTSSKGKDIRTFVQQEHKKRMGRDFYRFLGLREHVNYSEIDKSGKKLQKTFNRIKKAKRVTGDDEKKLDELIAGTSMVLTHLLDPTSREEYNRRKKAGRAPVVDLTTIQSSLPKPAKPQRKEHAYIQLIKEKKFMEALPLLKNLREENSSDPDILCDLGWTIWNIKKNKKDAEEYIRLAITFNNRHISSYTYLSEIYMETKDFETAKKYLTVLVKLQPQNQKAKADLAKVSSFEEEKPQKGWFRS